MSATNQINRRTFLAETVKLGAATMAASTVGPLLGAPAGGPAPKAAWQIGCYTRAFDQFEYPVALDAIAEAGFRYVGLMTTKNRAAAASTSVKS